MTAVQSSGHCSFRQVPSDIIGSIVKQWPAFITPTAEFSEIVSEINGINACQYVINECLHTRIVRHIGSCVEKAVDAVAAVALYYAVAKWLDVLLDHIPDIPVLYSRPAKRQKVITE